MKKIVLLLLSLIIQYGIKAQTKPMDNNVKKSGDANVSNIEVQYYGTAVPKWDYSNFIPTIDKIRKNNESDTQEELLAYKKKVNAEKLNYIKTISNNPQIDEDNQYKTTANTPTFVSGFETIRTVGSPSDNSIAINKNNQMVVMVNSNLRIYNESGNTLTANITLPNFFATISNGTRVGTDMCDPRVIFDNQANRFIVMAQTCDFGNVPSASATSQILLGFSVTSDPTGAWNFYGFTGNPSSISTSVWFDYPNIGISDHDVFITGNFFDNNGQYIESGIYQIDKTKCYAGGNNIQQGDAIFWSGISGSPFTMVPASSGSGTSIGNGMHLMSTGNGNTIKVYWISSAVQNNPRLKYNVVSIPSFLQPANAVQKDNTLTLITGDTRGMSAFKQNKTLHFVFHCLGDNQFTEIMYTRILLNTDTTYTSTSKRLKKTNEDFGYPSLTSLGYDINDQSTLVFFNTTSLTEFPGMKAIMVDHSMNISPPLSIKIGTATNHYLEDPNEGTRWGDYTGSARDFSQSIPSVWTYGMFSKSSNSAWYNYAGLVKTADWHLSSPTLETVEEQTKIYPNPVINLWNLKLNIKQNGLVNVSIFEVNGRLVKDMISQNISKGETLLSFNKAALSPGTYFVRITLDNQLIKNEKLQIQ